MTTSFSLVPIESTIFALLSHPVPGTPTPCVVRSHACMHYEQKFRPHTSRQGRHHKYVNTLRRFIEMFLVGSLVGNNANSLDNCSLCIIALPHVHVVFA